MHSGGHTHKNKTLQEYESYLTLRSTTALRKKKFVGKISRTLIFFFFLNFLIRHSRTLIDSYILVKNIYGSSL